MRWCVRSLAIALAVHVILSHWITVAQTESPSPAASIVAVRSGQGGDRETLLRQWSQLDVLYLGETHDAAADHRAQLEIIQALQHHHPRLLIGMEMFQRPYQPILDRYLSGQLSELELKRRSQYETRWGFDWEFYAPMLRFAREKGLPVIALNTPSEVSRKVARHGLESLNRAERRFIPPASAIMPEPDAYRQKIRQIYDELHQGKGNSDRFERFFLTQVLWDETMAERIAQVVQQRPDSLVVVLAGQGHLLYGYGIPQRVARRLPGVRQITVLLNPNPEIRAQVKERDEPAIDLSVAPAWIADYFWITQ